MKRWLIPILLMLGGPAFGVEPPEQLPNLKVDIGTSFDAWGWDAGPFRVGKGRVQALVEYKVLPLGKDWEAQVGWFAGTILSTQTVTELQAATERSVNGPTAGLRYRDTGSVNLFACQFAGTPYFNAGSWAVGIGVAVNPAQTLNWLMGE